MAAIDQEILAANTPPAAPEPPPAAPAPQPPAPPPPPPPQPQPQSENWQAKYLTLQGMFNAEVPKLQGQLRETLAEIERLKATAPEPAREPTTTTPASPKDIETFGADLAEFVQRIANDVARSYLSNISGHIAELRGEIVSLRGETGTTVAKQQKTEQELCLQRLGQLVPDYQQIDVQPGFHAWLAEEEGFTGIQRQALLNQALQNSDANRLAQIFNAYKAVSGQQAPMQQTPQPQPPAPNPARAELERQVSPGRSPQSSPTPPTEPQQLSFTHAQVKRFYDDVSRGHYRGRESEQANIEAQINAAAAKGMIR
jgi:hypothetical protein